MTKLFLFRLSLINIAEPAKIHQTNHLPENVRHKILNCMVYKAFYTLEMYCMSYNHVILSPHCFIMEIRKLNSLYAIQFAFELYGVQFRERANTRTLTLLQIYL